MTVMAMPFSPPKHHLCNPEECTKSMMIGDHERCSQCQPMADIKSTLLPEHQRWHASFCPCNWDETLANSTDHRGNRCHRCHRDGCGQVKTTEFGIHLVICCPNPA